MIPTKIIGKEKFPVEYILRIQFILKWHEHHFFVSTFSSQNQIWHKFGENGLVG